MADNLPSRPRQPRVMSRATGRAPAPPKHLRAESKRLWRAIVAEWVLDAAALPLLRAGLEQWDAYQAARAELAKDGPTFKTGDMIRVHPAAKVATDSLREFRMCFRQLGLEPPEA